MKFSKLKRIIENEAQLLKTNAGYSGAMDDGGSGNLTIRLNDFKSKLVREYDLRPSEFYKLEDIEVNEPSEFYCIITDYKTELAKNIKL